MAHGKKYLPWGRFKAHHEVAALKCDTIFDQFFESVSPNYKLLIPALSYHLTVSRNRNGHFTPNDYDNIYQNYQNVFISQGYIKDNVYDWL